MYRGIIAPSLFAGDPTMPPPRSLLLLCAALVALGHWLHAGEVQPPASSITYEQDIRPILKANCFHCHGEQAKLSGGLDLRLRTLLVKGGDSGPAIVPGKAGESLLVEYVSSGEMPPKEELRLSERDVALITQWVEMGAPTLEAEPEHLPAPGEFLLTAQDRQHWAFRPIVKPPLPPPIAGLEATNPIDHFVAAKLNEKGLSFSPEADRITLLRRATFDLLGLPPTPDQVTEFLADAAPDAYERLIERLLDSPHYGERWGRHWLDLAGYADSEGYTDADDIRPDAWHYRDYVIQSFNADKPWDQFLVQQLAGDELAQATHANAQGLANQDPHVRELLTATGYLRMAPDGTGSKPMDAVLARNQVITETIKIISSSLLGMTVGCAECHDHRFDPIPQEDFYRLRAVLAPVFDHENWRNPDARRVAILSAEDQARANELEAEARKLDADYLRVMNETVQLIFERVLETLPEDQREFARQTYVTDPKDRTPEQKKFIEEQYPMVNVQRTTLHLFIERYEDGKELKQKYEDLAKQAQEIRAKKPQPDYVRLATEDVKHVPATHVFFRGDVSSPEKETIAPGGLSVLSHLQPSAIAEDDPDLPTSGRRLALARRLTDGTHPLVARVLVNRFWMHHFGRALVTSTGDFGLRATPPTHPELLDWLSADFMENGWRLKRLHKLMMTSRTYRQSSQRRHAAEQVDTDNALLWRMPVRRLEAEAVRDAVLQVSGALDTTLGGAPVPVIVTDVGLVDVDQSTGRFRRSLYTQMRRSQPVYLLEAFDSPNMEPNCECRTASTVATQSLTMLNDQFVLRQADVFADRVLGQLPEQSPLPDQVALAWNIAYQRAPRASELEVAVPYLEQQLKDFTAAKVPQPRRAALASLCQVIFGSNEFLYVE